MYRVYIDGELALISDSAVYAYMKASEYDHELEAVRRYKGEPFIVTVEKRK